MNSEIECALCELRIAADLARKAKSTLLKAGFSKEETDDILSIYVYEKVNKEE